MLPTHDYVETLTSIWLKIIFKSFYIFNFFIFKQACFCPGHFTLNMFFSKIFAYLLVYIIFWNCIN